MEQALRAPHEIKSVPWNDQHRQAIRGAIPSLPQRMGVLVLLRYAIGLARYFQKLSGISQQAVASIRRHLYWHQLVVQQHQQPGK